MTSRAPTELASDAEPPSELHRLLYVDPIVTIGIFECPVDHPLFRDSGPASGDLVVFPRSPVEILQAGRRALVADHTVITLYNQGQEYQRRPLADRGDRSIFLRFSRKAVIEALRETGRTHPRLDQAPFSAGYSRCSAPAFLEARRLLHTLLDFNAPASMAIEECAYELLHHAAANQASSGSRSARRSETEARHQRLVEGCQALLASRYREDLNLAGIAADLATTPFHLSRVFSARTGQTIHRHLMQLRLRAGLDLLMDEPERSLTDIGTTLGFATPSHFTERFRRSFGSTPGAFRRRQWAAAAG